MSPVMTRNGMPSSKTAFRNTDDPSRSRGETADSRGTRGTTKRGRFLDVGPGAKKQWMELTPAHLEVVRFLQAYASEHESMPDARELADAMAQHFERQGGRRYLYRLFPKGPVTQASKIAGLEIPDAQGPVRE